MHDNDGKFGRLGRPVSIGGLARSRTTAATVSPRISTSCFEAAWSVTTVPPRIRLDFSFTAPRVNDY